MKLIDVTKNNVEQTGFFCKMSQKKNEGYKRKLDWLTARFDEGLKIKMLDIKAGHRGFIEYIPGKFAWRPVFADGYMFIHFLWVVGQSKGKGYSKLLVDECIIDAKKAGMKGIAMTVSKGNWLAGKDILLKLDFKSVDTAPPAFDLMILKFKKFDDPKFPNDWERRVAKFGDGFTVVRTDQCLYVDDASKTIKEYAEKKKIKFKEVELKNAEQVRKESPTPYGVFGIIYNKKFLSYHYLLPKDIEPAIRSLGN